MFASAHEKINEEMNLSAWTFKSQSEKLWIDAGYDAKKVQSCLANTDSYLKHGC